VSAGAEEVQKFLVVNADDFGASTGINRGIVEGHVRGIVTSASLMVTGRAVGEAVSLSGEHPTLSVGLHWDVWGEDEREFDIRDHGAVRDEFRRQVDEFHRRLGRLPTHIDSHRHAHREEHLRPMFRELVHSLGVPLREDGSVRFVGGFYAQWEWMKTNLEYVSVPFLEHLLDEEVRPGWTELSCHPGYVSADFTSVYLHEREAELRTLTDPRIPAAIARLGIRLASYADRGGAAQAEA
jgi:predicted glycoside hydrolase/deacetylase ChbG (UPF0249 family)